MYVLGEVDPAFLKEIWALYGVGAAVLVGRFAIRLRMVGYRGLRGDDVFAFLVLVCLTIGVALVDRVYYLSTNVEGAAIQKTRPLSGGEIRQLTKGSKMQLGAWYAYPSLVWSLKGTMIFFFKRMTLGLSHQRRLVNWIGIGTLIGYIAVICVFMFTCWPVHKNYQVVPDPGKSCTIKPQDFIVITVLNVLTDAAILYVPMPLLWALRIPLRKKIGIGILLSSGIFVITASIVRICSSLLVAHPSALTVNRWGVREVTVGIIAVNAVIYPPIFRKSFWRCGEARRRALAKPRPRLAGPAGVYATPATFGGGIDQGLTTTTITAGGGPSFITGSEENIIQKEKEEEGSGSHDELTRHGWDGQQVIVETSFEVRTELRTDGEMPHYPPRVRM